MKKILLSVLITAVVSTVAFGATRAYFSDTETSTGNTFTAGTLDLTVDGENPYQSIKITVADMKPGDMVGATMTGFFTDPATVQCTGGPGISRYYALQNIGSVGGYIDIENVVKTDSENTIIEPEAEAGDVTDTAGELLPRLMTRVWLDDGNHCVNGEEIYRGPLSGFGAIDYNAPLAAGATKYLGVAFYWQPGMDIEDSQAMTDVVQLDMTFELAQTTGQ